MRKVLKIFTVSLGIIGSSLLVASLFFLIFNNKISSITVSDITLICNAGIITLCTFFVASSFVFSHKNYRHRIARFISAILMGSALYFTLNSNIEMGIELGCILVSASLLIYNLFDLIYRKVKLPIIFLFIPMICVFTYSIVTYINKSSVTLLICSVIIGTLFTALLCYKASRLSNNQEEIQNITK